MSNNRYQELIKKALSQSSDKGMLYEGFGYPEHITERMHPDIEEAIKNRKTSVGDHPALPKTGVRAYDHKLLLDRFLEVTNACKEAFDVNAIDEVTLENITNDTSRLLLGAIKAEKPHRDMLEQMAIEIVTEDYGISEGLIEFDAKLVDKLTMSKQLTREFEDEEFSMEFEKAEDMDNAEGEIMKRRFVNAMVQGGANKCNHMYHMKNKELVNIDPTLLNKYKKLMAFNDYLYFTTPKPNNSTPAGVVNVKYTDEGKIKISAEALIFPILIHELVKGVLEAISLHGFTGDEKLNEFVVSQADFLSAEPWDLRMGPALWGRMLSCIPPEHHNMKHHVFHNLVKKPVNEFNSCMREIMVGTKEGKKIVSEIINEVKENMELDALEEELNSEVNSAKERTVSELKQALKSGIQGLIDRMEN
jgi:hypothetical protein